MSLSWWRALSRLGGRGNEDTATASAHSPGSVAPSRVPEQRSRQPGIEGPAHPAAKQLPTRGVVSEPTLRPGLLAEIQENRETAGRPWCNRPLPFKTAAWDDEAGGIVECRADLREELVQAYADMGLANNIVWLADDLGRRSDSLDGHYQQLCQSIVRRLERVMKLLGSA